MARKVRNMIIILSLSVPMVVQSAVIHVPGDQPTIQAGMDAASSGDTVLVADGTYTGTGNRDLNFRGKALTVRSESGPEFCVIDCEGNPSDPHRGFSFNNGEGQGSVVMGFTIRNGWSACGGGIYCKGSSPVIRNNNITGNTADHHGGGIYCEKSLLTLSYNTISANSSGLNGGGVFCYEGSSPAITHNTICGNESEFSGGGISSFWSSPNISNNTIKGNRAGEYGGGIDCYHSSPTVAHNTVNGNMSDYDGGGIYYCSSSSPAISYTTLIGNSPDAIYVDSKVTAVASSDMQNQNDGPNESTLHKDPLLASGGLVSSLFHLHFTFLTATP